MIFSQDFGKRDLMLPASGLSKLDTLIALRAGLIDREDHRVPEAARCSSEIQESNGFVDPRILSRSAVAEQSTASKTAAVPGPATSTDDLLSGVFLSLYLEGAVETDDSIGCSTLDGLETKDKLFAEVQAILDDQLDAGETVCVIRVRREDGEVFPGLNTPSVSITRGGKDVWNSLIKRILDQGIGDGGLRGYVKVKRGNENR